ncbi:hypothetical protein [Cohnella silvisoli]|uniref:Uncharacterized protein n=1 Tax=Cohnella silvisoli TaxID=2873699 RepID=A0ABV1KP82_9BACL|nr:hypothetical protein [Cohnella silvisoli]MCD9025661.1 hypothetical protein [Cohnella silvisoli]
MVEITGQREFQNNKIKISIIQDRKMTVVPGVSGVPGVTGVTGITG